jgi:hypothetical protein
MDDLIKIAIVLVVSPIWLPFVKAMMRELVDLFEEDGGLFGPDPGPIRRAEIRNRRANQPSVLVHEWLAHVRGGAGQGLGSVRQTGPGTTTGQGSSASQPRRVAANPRPGPRPGSRPGRATGQTSGWATGPGDDSGNQRPSFRR